jgi:hypothetical protein
MQNLCLYDENFKGNVGRREQNAHNHNRHAKYGCDNMRSVGSLLTDIINVNGRLYQLAVFLTVAPSRL